jgi:DNA topoisomerase-1
MKGGVSPMAARLQRRICSQTLTMANRMRPQPTASSTRRSRVRTSVNRPAVTSAESARVARLHYATDKRPGISRQRAGSGFVYRDARSRRIREAATLARIRALVIPPAWRHVWISPDPNSHLQVTGRDARGRKQYRYHPRWTEERDSVKYGRMITFARRLPAMRRRVRADLRQPPLSRPRVLATVIRLLETTLIRVGNEEYAKANKSFGLTTLHDRHVRVRGPKVKFRFRAKSGVVQSIDLEDATLARSVKRCQDLPGQTLFQYLDADGNRQSVDSRDVNDYLREISGEDFTAKDFRTWAGTVLAAAALHELARVDSKAARNRNIVQAVESVAKRLGNTRAVCRKCYVHPAVLDAYLDGTTIEMLGNKAARLITPPLSRLSREEVAVLALLTRRLSRESVARRGRAAA